MSIKDKIKLGRQRLGLNEEQFAKLVGVSRGAVQQWEKGDTAPNRARQPIVAEAIGLSVAELVDDASDLAHPLSPQPFKVPPITPWEEIRDMKRLPRTFTVPMPDDSMAGTNAKGTPLYFETGLEPEPGQGVYVVDRHGERNVRRFKKASGTRWIAEVENTKDFESLDSEKDGLKVLAVLRGVLSGRI